MIEQEMASVIHFLLKAAGNPTPYYWDIPQGFMVPAMYFPRPVIMTGPDTLETYYMDQTMYVKVFAKNTEQAMDIGRQTVRQVRQAKNLIPLIGKDGNALTEEFGKSRDYVRLQDPELSSSDECTCRMIIRWRSREPYNHIDVQKMMRFYVHGIGRGPND